MHVYNGQPICTAMLACHFVSFQYCPRASLLTSLFLIFFLEQVLSVAVYNHYKRIYLESVKKWLVLFLRPPSLFGLSFVGSSRASE